MTRITNFGRKRTYLEADTEQNATSDQSATQTRAVDVVESGSGEGNTSLRPKKRKKAEVKSVSRSSTVKRDFIDSGDVRGSFTEDTTVVDGAQDEAKQKTVRSSTPKAKLEKKGKYKLSKDRKSQSELRRQKRVEDRLLGTTCFACRETGHAAKDCPVISKNSRSNDANETRRKDIVGICYRCGSRRHTLSRCKKPTNSSNPLPFAFCFVCSGKGHLASSCAENNAKGIYPNGGCCMLCKETTHLAKNCKLRNDVHLDNNDSQTILGFAYEGGADEDDFHTLRRRKAEIEKDEKNEDKTRRLLDAKVGVHSGTVKLLGKPSVAAKKVVYF